MYIHFDVSGIPETSKFANSKHEHEQGSFIPYPLSFIPCSTLLVSLAVLPDLVAPRLQISMSPC